MRLMSLISIPWKDHLLKRRTSAASAVTLAGRAISRYSDWMDGCTFQMQSPVRKRESISRVLVAEIPCSATRIYYQLIGRLLFRSGLPRIFHPLIMEGLWSVMTLKQRPCMGSRMYARCCNVARVFLRACPFSTRYLSIWNAVWNG